MPSPLQNVLHAEGERRIIGGNTPVWLDDAEAAWLVCAGRVEVFTLTAAGPGPSSRRHYLTVRTGEAMFGAAPMEGTDRGLLAVGHPDTQVVRFPMALLRRLARQDEHRAEAARLLDTWITGLSAAVSRDINPRTDGLIGAGREIALKPGGTVRSEKGVVWIGLAGAPPLLFLDIEDVPRGGNAPAFFPLTQDARLSAPKGGTLRAAATPALLDQDEFWAGLPAFWDLVFRCEDMNQRLSVADELNRIWDRQQWDSVTADRTLDELRSIGTGHAPAAAVHAFSEPLLAACRLAGTPLGLEVRKPSGWQEGRSAASALPEIALASRFRIRQVNLEGEWWKAEHGALVGFLADTGAPVALLHSSSGTYTIHDPAAGSALPVTPGTAKRLQLQAYMLYPNLPARAVRMRELLRLGLRGSGRDLLIMTAMAAAGGLMTAIGPLLTRTLYDTILPAGSRGQLLLIPGALSGIALAFLAFQFTRNFAKLRLETRLGLHVQAMLMDRLLALPVQFFRQFAAGDLATRVTGVSAIWPTVSGIVAILLLSLFTGLFNAAIMFSFDARLGWTGLALLAAAAGPGMLYAHLQAGHLKQAVIHEGNLTSTVLQLLTGMSKIRSAGAEVQAFATWGHAFGKMQRRKSAAQFHGAWFQTFSRSFPFLAQMVLFWMAGSVLLSQSGGAEIQAASAGEFLGFLAAFTNALAVTLGMTLAWAQAGSVTPVLDRLRPILDCAPETDDTKKAPGELAGAIEISHLSYRYRPELPPVLTDVSFSVRPGEFVAVVGPSGSGKSTLLRLLLGFDNPETGAIHYDGQDLATLDLASVRRQIGTVMQDGRPLPGSILDNIRGSRPLSADQCWEAIRLAGLETDIREMPMGIHSMVSAGGSVFSGGQFQRMLIARALAPRPRILFFDEATSALDNRTQAQVIKSLRELQATRVVIAHRLSTIQDADRIVVISAGQKTQEGTFQELIAQPGAFADLARRQMLDPNLNVSDFLF